MKYGSFYLLLVISLSASFCKPVENEHKNAKTNAYLQYDQETKNILDYKVTPKNISDRSGLMFSDQGAWFAYGLPESGKISDGFSGPFLMTQQNGVWSSPCLSQLLLFGGNGPNVPNVTAKPQLKQAGYPSHLERAYKDKQISIEQKLVFLSGHTAIQKTVITNLSSHSQEINPVIQGKINDIGIKFSNSADRIKLTSVNSNAIGYIGALSKIESTEISDNGTFYSIVLPKISLKPNASEEIIISQTFIFPEYSWEKEKQLIAKADFDSILNTRKTEKAGQWSALLKKRKATFKEEGYGQLLAKAQLTLQNNWRIAAGELKHQGLFPSYHYEWFHGFWSWDSWKHAVGLSYYDLPLAKDQIRAMFDFQDESGFIVDCVYRDTTIEAHNYRDTKPPLAAWAVAKIAEKEGALDFIEEMYPKLKKYHNWWYTNRDHDKDGLCEFGSTDGTLIAAKWESGMDNAIRFDNSKIVKNSAKAYSLNQESVDLNAYLFAEKIYLAFLAEKLQLWNDAATYIDSASILKERIQNQFYDQEDGWFYDTNLEGTSFIKGTGSEGWTALWANAATQQQAEMVKNQMMDTKKFYSKVPFQTMSMDHPKFDPLEGYWRGPNWLDQAYFGVKALRNYGFDQEADKATVQILQGAEGLMEQGKSIRENYHPITGKGLYAKNFSWSAAHIIMLLTVD
ncbi:MGH1-like glycoside hydrolase domain-containing protein [Spongiimicrobium sp. 3-5]|uniref:MGH1-like glycoside hydrolase domain-containing protein n=1 Tax=Spongiimicrobium sp. 3-5 TaxID=3332596 RepID=UPI0039805DF2